ncbi:FecR family protein [Pedobacter nyackensis]|uniref:FecR family protein n=1 Tax=Pedobacter nyackensis TaxID=475255 RepID=A0A1W2CYD7_9SPHI|nr:FecR domain-containing protein [Pedobacter nyackensis]SMC90221.1 FecR family protein [Pedobacter nyackensis]
MKLHTRQLVAEALSLMSKSVANSLPVYDDGQFIGKITYVELKEFINDEAKTDGTLAHRMNFELGTAWATIKKMRIDGYKEPAKENYTRKLVVRFSSAAAVALVLLGLTWLFFKPADLIPAAQQNLVITGLNKIMLVLANGEQVPLNGEKKGVTIDGSKLIYNDGSNVLEKGMPSLDKKLMAVYTSNGGLYQLTLPDGTKVWLNAASSLKFPATFAGASQRRVELSGEAYFEVAKVIQQAKRLPFIVVSDGQEIEVLGTHFNVSAYKSNGGVRTTLLEGSVMVRLSAQKDKLSKTMDPASVDPLKIEGGKTEVLLKPNEEAILTGTDIAVKHVDAAEAIAWRNGEYIFRNTSLNDIMDVVARWYDMDVVYQSKGAGDAVLGGSIARAATIQDVLKMLELIADVHFKIEGRRITVK